MFNIILTIQQTSFDIQQNIDYYIYGKSLHRGDHYFLLPINETYQPRSDGVADFYYKLYNNASQAALKVTYNYYYSKSDCSSINENNVNSKLQAASRYNEFFYAPSYSGVKCMVAKVNFNVITDLSIKAFSIKKVNLGYQGGLITSQTDSYYYEYTSKNSQQLLFSTPDGTSFSSLRGYVYDLTDKQGFLESDQTIYSNDKGNYNTLNIPLKYTSCLIKIVDGGSHDNVYIGYGDNPYPYTPVPPPQPENKSSTYILEYSGSSLYVNPTNSISSDDTVYVFKSVSMQQSSSEADFGYLAMMTKYNNQSISMYQTSSVNYSYPSSGLSSVSANSYGLYKTTGSNKYLVIQSYPKVTITTSDKYGINKAYYSSGKVSSHFFFVLKNGNTQISQIKFGIDTNYQLPQIEMARAYSSYDFNDYTNVASNIIENKDGNYYQFTTSTSSQTYILEVALKTSYDIQLAINGNIPYPAPQKNDTNVTVTYNRIIQTNDTEFWSIATLLSFNQSYTYYIMRQLDTMMYNESTFKYYFFSSLNTTSGFSMYEAYNCRSLNENNIDDNIQRMQPDNYGYVYPSGSRNCIVLKFQPSRNYINENISLGISKVYLTNGIVKDNFVVGYTPNTPSRTFCIGTYQGRSLPNPYSLSISDGNLHSDTSRRIYINQAQVYNDYMCYTINDSYNNAILYLFSHSSTNFILTVDNTNPYYYITPIQPNTPDNDNKSNNTKIIIISCVVGGVLLIGIVIGISIFIYVKKHKKQSQVKDNENTIQKEVQIQVNPSTYM